MYAMVIPIWGWQVAPNRAIPLATIATPGASGSGSARALSVLASRESRRRVYERIAARAGLALDPPACWLLFRIDQDAPATLESLSARLRVPVAVLTPVLDRLTQAGLVVVDRAARDGRAADPYAQRPAGARPPGRGAARGARRPAQGLVSYRNRPNLRSCWAGWHAVCDEHTHAAYGVCRNMRERGHVSTIEQALREARDANRDPLREAVLARAVNAVTALARGQDDAALGRRRRSVGRGGPLSDAQRAGTGADVDRAVAAARAAFDEGPWPRLSRKPHRENPKVSCYLRDATLV
jgi:DNA-binding IscR family transcriptional regulator